MHFMNGFQIFFVPVLTWYLKFQKYYNIPNTRILAERYQTPDLKAPCIPYT